MDTVRAVPLDATAFAPFGDVVSAGLADGRAANQGTAVRHDFAAQLNSTRLHSRPNLAVFRCLPQALPFVVRLLEKHPCTSQAFLPLKVSRYLVVVAPALPQGPPDVSGLRAFLCGPGQGINYRANVWHHPMVALDVPAEFCMLAWEDGTAQDCVESPLVSPLQVHG